MTELGRAARAPSEAGKDGNSGNGGDRRARWGLRARIGLGVAGLAVGLVVVFTLLIAAVVGLRHRSLESRHSQQVIATANGLETLVLDFESGLRGFVITNREQYLDPWRRARAEYPSRIAALIRMTSDDRDQHDRALVIKAQVDAYLSAYSLRFMEFLRRNPSAAAFVAAAARQVNAIRAEVSKFLAVEQARGAARDARARRTARRAVIAALVALGGGLVFLLAAAIYLARAVARPVRLAAHAAEAVAAGDLSGRLPTGGPGEIGQLEQSFNAMADSLQRTLDELEERNTRLVESERLKTELVSNVSHELRTPLASILGFSDVMLKRDLDSAKQRHYLEVIRTESTRLATLLNDLLDLQQQEQGAIELRPTDFDLNELVSVQVTLYSAQSTVHELVFKPSAGPLLVYADRDRLAQVIGNLLSNAIKYSPDGGLIEVSTASTDGESEAWLWVRDRGLGIPREQQHQIFTKFFRGDAARRRGISGTGLGLVLSQQTVEAHGGKLGFESEEGRGSTFWVRLPAVAGASGAAARDETEARHGT
jgi:signal transduction histidine kinase